MAQRKRIRAPRNFVAVSARLRRAGPMKPKREISRSRTKQILRKQDHNE